MSQAMVLSAVGGFLDAYTFELYRVFANAQSGNVVLFGVNAASGDWRAALLRLAPIAAFVIGVLVVEILSRPAARRLVRRPLRLVLAVEIVGLAVIAVLPEQTPELVIVVTVSFVASLQFSTFRLLAGAPYTTLLTSGNLRSAVVGLYHGIVDHDEAARGQGIRYTLVVGCFTVGAAGGAALTRMFGHRAVGVVPVLLLIVFLLIVAETRRIERAAHPTAARAAVEQGPTGEAEPASQSEESGSGPARSDGGSAEPR